MVTSFYLLWVVVQIWVYFFELLSCYFGLFHACGDWQSLCVFTDKTRCSLFQLFSVQDSLLHSPACLGYFPSFLYQEICQSFSGKLSCSHCSMTVALFFWGGGVANNNNNNHHRKLVPVPRVFRGFTLSWQNWNWFEWCFLRIRRF